MPATDFVRDLGARWDGYDDGRYLVSLVIDKGRHQNGGGTVHGGVICSLLDAAMGKVFYDSIAESGSKTATLEIKVNFLKAAKLGTLRAYGTLGKGTRRTGYVEGHIEDDDGNLIAKGSSTFIVLV